MPLKRFEKKPRLSVHFQLSPKLHHPGGLEVDWSINAVLVLLGVIVFPVTASAKPR
jgi:hypothetical protein